MIDIKDIALIYSFDFPHKIKNSNNIFEFRYYDEEFLKSVRYWRKNAGWLKDIQIYALLYGNISLYNNKIIEELKRYNVIFYIDEINDVNLTWEKCLTAGVFFEKNINEKILIRIDLDMYCLKELNYDLIRKAENNILIGQYDEKNKLDQRKTLIEAPFDTSLIISDKRTNFYQKYLQFFNSDKTYETNEWKNIITKYNGYFKTEYVIDYMVYNNLINIIPIRYHQFGEGYRNISLYSKDEIKKICFLHEHIRHNQKYYDNYDPTKAMITYLKNR